MPLELKKVNFEIKEEIYITVKNYCFENGLKLSWFIEQAILNYLEEKGRYEKPIKPRS